MWGFSELHTIVSLFYLPCQAMLHVIDLRDGKELLSHLACSPDNVGLFRYVPFLLYFHPSFQTLQRWNVHHFLYDTIHILTHFPLLGFIWLSPTWISLKLKLSCLFLVLTLLKNMETLNMFPPEGWLSQFILIFPDDSYSLVPLCCLWHLLWIL